MRMVLGVATPKDMFFSAESPDVIGHLTALRRAEVVTLFGLGVFCVVAEVEAAYIFKTRNVVIVRDRNEAIRLFLAYAPKLK